MASGVSNSPKKIEENLSHPKNKRYNRKYLYRTPYKNLFMSASNSLFEMWNLSILCEIKVSVYHDFLDSISLLQEELHLEYFAVILHHPYSINNESIITVSI